MLYPLVYVHCGPVVDFFITKQTSLHPFDFVRNLFHLLVEVTSVKELLDLLKPHYFQYYALLEKMIKFFLNQDTIAEDLRDYLYQLAKFKSSTTVKQFMDSIEQAQQSDSTTSEGPGLCTVKLRLVGDWLTKTMDDLEKLVKEIFKDKAYVLSHLKIVRGSVIVTYSAPLSEAESLVMLALEQSAFVAKVGVIQLIVGDKIIPITKSDSLDYSFESNSLLKAIKDNDLNLTMFLLKINTDPNTADQGGQTPLIYAIYYNRDRALSLPLNANANPNLQTNEGVTPLFLATQIGNTDVVSLLLKANSKPNIQCDDGVTPLYIV